VLVGGDGCVGNMIAVEVHRFSCTSEEDGVRIADDVRIESTPVNNQRQHKTDSLSLSLTGETTSDPKVEKIESVGVCEGSAAGVHSNADVFHLFQNRIDMGCTISVIPLKKTQARSTNQAHIPPRRRTQRIRHCVGEPGQACDGVHSWTRKETTKKVN
jgi:hypothetical protein